MGFFKEAPYKKAIQNIIDVIGCNYKVFDTACTTEDMNRIYLEEVKRGKEEGFVPVLVPCDDILNEWFQLEEEDKEDAFSTDRVYQCTVTYTLGELAGCLMDSKVWYFWWD